IITGGVLISIFPLLIGILLDTSYRKKRKIYQSLKQQEPETMEPGPSSLWPGVPVELSMSLPGQYWRMLTGRSLLVLSALFWAVVILTVIAKFPSKDGQEFSILMGAWVIGFFPVYTGFLLEDSYRKRNKRFNLLFRRFPQAQIPRELLTISPPGQGWKVVFSRFLLGLAMLYWVALFMMYFFSSASGAKLLEVFLSGLLTTIIPIAAALMLEGSYRKKQLVFRAFQDKIAAEPLVRKKQLTQW
ncbi:MAG: hypothetical protein GY940_30450, partial [bacterium]|nr:hypothetical protein [bacterium]